MKERQKNTLRDLLKGTLWISPERFLGTQRFPPWDKNFCKIFKEFTKHVFSQDPKKAVSLEERFHQTTFKPSIFKSSLEKALNSHRPCIKNSKANRFKPVLKRLFKTRQNLSETSNRSIQTSPAHYCPNKSDEK